MAIRGSFDQRGQVGPFEDPEADRHWGEVAQGIQSKAYGGF